MALVDRIKSVLAQIKIDISTKVSKSGDTLTGKLVSAASSVAGASLNIPMGVAPTTPIAGDLWRLSSGFRYQNDSNQAVTLYDSNNLNWGVLGYTPVQQGTGIGQTTNSVKLGWSAGGKLKLTIDSTDLGYFAMENWVTTTIATSISGKADTGGNYPSMSVGTATNAGNANTVGGWSQTSLRDWNNLIGKPALVYPDSGTYSINITGSSGYSSNSGNANTVGGWAQTALRDWNNLINKPNLVYPDSGTYPINVTGTSSYSTNSGNANLIGGYPVTSLWRTDSVTYSCASSGYFIYPPDSNGKRKIEQWGQLPATGGYVAITFPMQFPNACFGVVPTVNSNTYDATHFHLYTEPPTVSGCVIHVGGINALGGYYYAWGW